MIEISTWYASRAGLGSLGCSGNAPDRPRAAGWEVWEQLQSPLLASLRKVPRSDHNIVPQIPSESHVAAHCPQIALKFFLNVGLSRPGTEHGLARGSLGIQIPHVQDWQADLYSCGQGTPRRVGHWAQVLRGSSPCPSPPVVFQMELGM